MTGNSTRKAGVEAGGVLGARLVQATKPIGRASNTAGGTLRRSARHPHQSRLMATGWRRLSWSPHRHPHVDLTARRPRSETPR